MKVWKPDEPDLRFAHDKEILKGIPDKPDNAVIYYIGNYPTDEILSDVDFYARNLKPPNSMWDDVLRTGDSKEVGSGWASTGFPSKYAEYIVEDDRAYSEALHIKARSLVRPIYIGHHPENKMYSPASVCIDAIKTVVELEHEREGGWGVVTFEGKG